MTVTNNCGTISISDVADYSTCPYVYRYAAYPNPADDALTVEQTDSTSGSTGTQRTVAARGPATTAASSSSAAPGTPYTVHLYDNYGTQAGQQATTSPTVQLPTSGLPTGLYLLHIEAGGAVVERRRIQITH